MSKQSYINGFCKAAAANGVDPKALAQFAVQKEAQDAGAPAAGAGTGKSEVWAKVMEAINKAKAKTVDAAKSTAQWYGRQNQATKALIGAGLGSAVGTGLGAALAGKKGLSASSRRRRRRTAELQSRRSIPLRPPRLLQLRQRLLPEPLQPSKVLP